MKSIEFLKDIEQAIEDNCPKKEIKGFCVIVCFDDCDLVTVEDGEEYNRMLGLIEDVKFNMMADRRKENLSILENCLPEEGES